jgi:hypothetical protein
MTRSQSETVTATSQAGASDTARRRASLHHNGAFQNETKFQEPACAPKGAALNFGNEMKRILNVLFVIVVVILPCRVSITAESHIYDGVAEYMNTPELRATVGVRIAAILNAHNIKWGREGSFGMGIYVPPGRASEARQLLAKAAIEEKLPLTILVREKHAYARVEPDRFLNSKKPQ